MDSERPDEGSTAHKTDSSDVLSDWNAELSKEKDTAVSAQTRTAGNFARLTQNPESLSSSRKREERQKRIGK